MHGIRTRGRRMALTIPLSQDVLPSTTEILLPFLKGFYLCIVWPDAFSILAFYDIDTLPIVCFLILQILINLQ